VALALFGATPSKAGTVFFDFDLSDSSLMLGDGELSLPTGRGATVTGTARIALSGVNWATIEINDPLAAGEILSLDLRFDIRTPFIPGTSTGTGSNVDATFVASLRLSQTGRVLNFDDPNQMGSVVGDFDGSLVTFPAGRFNPNLAARLDCEGAQCPAVERIGMITFPLMQDRPLSNGQLPFQFSVSNFGGRATLRALIMGSAGSGTPALADTLPFVLDIRGRELTRFAIPEPVEAGLLMLGALALCSAVAVRRRAA
jgi:hypothetical protein